MSTSLTWYVALIALVVLERVAELVLSRRHAAWALARGGVEFGAGHYPAMVLLHSALLAGALGEAWLADRPFVPALGWAMVALVVLTQGLRWWCIATLGRQWNTRVIVVPGLPLQLRRGGPRGHRAAVGAHVLAHRRGLHPAQRLAAERADPHGGRRPGHGALITPVAWSGMRGAGMTGSPWPPT
jgi:hypothetical protein